MDEFSFKQFKVSHCRSSMKVGIDAVLIGAWGEVAGKRGLDIGCGCGLIALMAAQRNTAAMIDAIDIDPPSVAEASINFKKSPWSTRLDAHLADANEFAKIPQNKGFYDFILSNPPFFNCGLKSIASARECARHQDSISPLKLIELSESLLVDYGTLSMILPYDQLPEIKKSVILKLEKLCVVADKQGKRPKRVMVNMRKTSDTKPIEESLYIRNLEGGYTHEYLSLTQAFYLNLGNK